MVRQCDRKIEKNKRRAEQNAAISEDDLKKLATIEKQINDTTELCEKAAEGGDIDQSLEYMKQVQLIDTAFSCVITWNILYPYVCSIMNWWIKSRLHEAYELKFVLVPIHIVVPII